jgi:hypothetical protein
MGPGYFPMILGVCLIVLGIISIYSSVLSNTRTQIDQIRILPIFFVVSGIFMFSLLIDSYGLAIALFCLIVPSCYNRLRTHFIEVIAIYAALLGVTWLVFIRVLQLPLSVFP